jgi:hypothetical protein
MASAEREPIWRFGGGAPIAGPRAGRALVRGLRYLKLAIFCILTRIISA